MKKIVYIITLLVLIVVVSGCTTEHEHDHDDEHDHSVEIEGSDMKLLSVQDVADLWEIDSEVLLLRIVQEFDMKGSYTVDSVLEDMREEYKFSPAQIKDMAEEIKQQGM